VNSAGIDAVEITVDQDAGGVRTRTERQTLAAAGADARPKPHWRCSAAIV